MIVVDFTMKRRVYLIPISIELKDAKGGAFQRSKGPSTGRRDTLLLEGPLDFAVSTQLPVFLMCITGRSMPKRVDLS
ncbi:MAG: hypothetical protein U0892_07630 [Pirellulales bacterium]